MSLDDNSLTQPVAALAREAGAAICDIYRRGFQVAYKDDRSPVTDADLAAHRILVAGLSALTPSLPVLSEESAAGVAATERLSWPRYWLVDPLDGTREFVKRNDEFTVNIALIEAGLPCLGVVYAPVLDEMAVAERGRGAVWQQGGPAIRLRARSTPAVPVLAISRSHGDARTRALIDGIGECELAPAGSSLKFIRVAHGCADLYPRFGPTSEWDTAAGQCVLEEAGGAVLDLHGRAFRYNRGDSLLNGSFLALGDRSAASVRRWLALADSAQAGVAEAMPRP